MIETTNEPCQENGEIGFIRLMPNAKDEEHEMSLNKEDLA